MTEVGQGRPRRQGEERGHLDLLMSVICVELSLLHYFSHYNEMVDPVCVCGQWSVWSVCVCVCVGG